MCRFAPPDKRRPVLVPPRHAALTRLRTAIVAPIISTIHGLPSEVPIGAAEGMKHACAVNLDHLYTVEKSALRAWVGRLDERRMREVCEAVNVALGCR